MPVPTGLDTHIRSHIVLLIISLQRCHIDHWPTMSTMECSFRKALLPLRIQGKYSHSWSLSVAFDTLICIRGMTLDEGIYSVPFDFSQNNKVSGNHTLLSLLVSEGGILTLHSQTWTPLIPHRVCPGRYLINDSLWIAMAAILAAPSISKAVDSDGKEITPDTAVETGITRHAHYPLSRIQCSPARTLIAIQSPSHAPSDPGQLGGCLWLHKCIRIVLNLWSLQEPCIPVVTQTFRIYVRRCPKLSEATPSLLPAAVMHERHFLSVTSIWARLKMPSCKLARHQNLAPGDKP